MENQKQFTVTEELYATHSQRFLNWLADMVIQVLLLFVILVFIMAIAETNGNKALQQYIVNMNTVAQYTVSAVILLVYYNVFEIFFSRTVGKFITNTIVVDENGDAPGYEMIMVRSLCRLIPLYGISLLGIPPRGWHDSISKTYVVAKKELEEKKRLFYAMQPNTIKEEA